jgi:tripartite-type tricarboxylate transporter receptor subunit TctC
MPQSSARPRESGDSESKRRFRDSRFRGNERVGRILVMLANLLLAVASLSPAAAFPERPVRIIVPYAPGGGNDALARVLAQKLEEQWGKPVVVENRSGGNTIIATEYVGRQPADGYNILVVTTVFAVNPSLLQKLPYDTLKQFTPVVHAGSAPNVLVTKPTLPVNSVKELIAYGHANPGKLTYGHPGIGTTPHLAVELFNSDAQIKAVGVSYRGTQPQLVAMLAGEIDYAFDVTSSLSHVQAGKLKGLAVTVSHRLERFPDMPTMIEAGLPGYEAYTWFGFVVPAGTPSNIVTAINQAMNKGLQDPTVRTRMDNLGINLVGGTPQDFVRHIASEMDKWGSVIRKTGIKPQAGTGQ